MTGITRVTVVDGRAEQKLAWLREIAPEADRVGRRAAAAGRVNLFTMRWPKGLSIRDTQAIYASVWKATFEDAKAYYIGLVHREVKLTKTLTIDQAADEAVKFGKQHSVAIRERMIQGILRSNMGGLVSTA